LPIALSCVFSEEFVAHASATSQGTKMPRANWDLLSKYPVPIAPNGVLSLFNDYITGTISKLSLLVRQNQNLRKTRDLLLPKLLSGQLDVEELDIVV
jgi:type I restriction enzyme S subunit